MVFVRKLTTAGLGYW